MHADSTDSVVFCIDLDKSTEILEFHPSEYNKDLESFKKNSVYELQDYNRRIFRTESEASKFRLEYLTALRALDNSRICKSRDLPCMLYKRRFIVLSLLGLKNQTFRHYKRNFERGTLFNLHDQTYFLTVRLDELIEHKKNLFEYRFSLAT